MASSPGRSRGLALGGWTDREVDVATASPGPSGMGSSTASGARAWRNEPEGDGSLSPVSAALAELALYEAQEDVAFSRGAYGVGEAYGGVVGATSPRPSLTSSPRRQKRHEVALSDARVSHALAAGAVIASDEGGGSSSSRPYAEGPVSFLLDPLGAVDAQALDLKLAAERGEAGAQHEVARRYLFGVAGMERSDAEAARWLRRAAENGVVGAMYNLGSMLMTGRAGTAGAQSAGRPWRDTRAFQCAEGARWFRRAADGGHAKAAYSLGALFAKGQGVGEDHVEAARWFRVARAAGVPTASYALGNLHKRGQGVSHDDAEAARLWEEAVSLGSVPDAAYNLGLAYLEGSGVGRSAELARKWFEIAALPAVDEEGEGRVLGSAEAAYNLGVMHGRGEGGPKCHDEALRWIHAAADPERGNWAQAQLALGHAHAQGLFGLARNGSEAELWYRRAAAQGSKEAKAALQSAKLGPPGDERPVPRPRPGMDPEEARSTLHELRRRAWVEGNEDAAAALRAAGRDPEFVRAAGESCSNCGTRGLDHFACANCRSAMYCNAKCQEEHWNRHMNGHRFRCRKPGAENVDPLGSKTAGKKAAGVVTQGSRANYPGRASTPKNTSPSARKGLQSRPSSAAPPRGTHPATTTPRPISAREWSPAW